MYSLASHLKCVHKLTFAGTRGAVRTQKGV